MVVANGGITKIFTKEEWERELMRVALTLKGLTQATWENVESLPDWFDDASNEALESLSESLQELVVDESPMLADEVTEELRVAKYFG